MLIRKMIREIRGNMGQFISVLILSFLATFIYSGFESNVIGSGRAVSKFHDKTNIADLWIYSEGFTTEDLDKVKELDIVEDAQLRTMLKGTTVDYGGAQLDLYLMDESVILKPYLCMGNIGKKGSGRLNEDAGVPFDGSDTEGVWLSWSFADAWNISVGDTIELEVNGVRFSKTIRGLIMEPEYEYTKAEKDSDTNFKNLAYIYMGYDAFSTTEFAEYMLDIPYTNMLVTYTEEAKRTAEKKTKGGSSELGADMYYENVISDALGGDYAVMIDRTSVIGIQRITDELDQHDAFSYTFAFIFLLVAVLVISTTMSRMVERQRTQIGTMNAMGMKRWKIAFHYMGYSFFVAFIGSVLGLILGPAVIGELIVGMLMDWYMIPNVSAGSNMMFWIVAAVVVIVCVLASFLSCRKLLRVPPAAALRPAAPKKAKRIFAERFRFWNKLGFSTQYNLRDVARAPLRAVMGIVGSAVGMVLVIYAFGCYVLVDDIVDWNFSRLQNYSYQMALSNNMPVKYFDELCEEVEGELVMTDQVELAKKPHAPAADRYKQTITVIEGKGLQNITDEETEITTMVPGKVAITSRLSKDMGLKVGDKVYWHIYSKNEWYESEIGLINRSPETAGITFLRKDFEETGCEYTPTAIVTKKDIMNYRDTDGVAGVYDMKEIKDAFVEGYSVIKYLFYMMMIFSVVTVVVVLYNAGNLSFHERLKEFATLKVMGMSTERIRKILNQENIWFAVIGILVGMPLGKPSLLAMMNSNGDNFDYYVRVPFYLYLMSAAFVMLVAVIVSHMFSKKIRRLDMVGTLKGIE